MKHPWLFLTSILLNLVLLGVGGWRLAGKPTPPQPAPIISNEPIPTPSAATPAFRWSQLEAGDYPTYIARLRAIGCPEETIRDLITADVASQYEEKRRQLLAANSSQRGEPVFFPTAPPRVLEPHLSPAGGSSPSLAAGDHPAASAPSAQMLPNLAQEQMALLSTLLPSPPLASQAAPGAADATEKAAAVGTLATAVPAHPSTTHNPPRDTEREMRPRGGLTHEQEVLRAKVGWQAFYYTTAEENAQERAAGNAR